MGVDVVEAAVAMSNNSASQRTSQQEAPRRKSNSRVVAYISDYCERLIRQELTACLSPIPSMFYSALFFFVLTVVAIPLGAALYWQTLENSEVEIRYDNFQLNAMENPLTDVQRRDIVTHPRQNFSRLYPIRITEGLESPVN